MAIWGGGQHLAGGGGHLHRAGPGCAAGAAPGARANRRRRTRLCLGHGGCARFGCAVLGLFVLPGLWHRFSTQRKRRGLLRCRACACISQAPCLWGPNIVFCTIPGGDEHALPAQVLSLLRGFMLLSAAGLRHGGRVGMTGGGLRCLWPRPCARRWAVCCMCAAGAGSPRAK